MGDLRQRRRLLTVCPLLSLMKPSYSSSVLMPAMCGPIWEAAGGGFLGGWAQPSPAISTREGGENGLSERHSNGRAIHRRIFWRLARIHNHIEDPAVHSIGS